jgi:homoserine O-acetyltransferase
MPKELPAHSVGIVTPQTHHFSEPLTLASGGTLSNYDLVYETYGKLNAERSNAVLICHALSGTHHSAGYHSMTDEKPGWWDNYIGPNKPIDTTRFFVVSPNNLGGCHGSTGPISVNPETGTCYGPDFPMLTVKDWINSQKRLGEVLGISQWAAIAGGSLGGMQALQWAIDYPEKVRHSIVIAATPKLTAQNIAFNEVARQAISSDPDFRDGHYCQQGTLPRKGLMLARMLGHITYLSDDSMAAKFGSMKMDEALREKFSRKLRAKLGQEYSDELDFCFNVDFQVESYLRYQGVSFAERFDANTYRLITKILDYFDPAGEFGNNLTEALAKVQAGFLVISFSSDWRFSPARSREIVKALIDNRKKVTYAEINVIEGHDSFLMPIPHYRQVFQAYMQGIDL